MILVSYCNILRDRDIDTLRNMECRINTITRNLTWYRVVAYAGDDQTWPNLTFISFDWTKQPLICNRQRFRWIDPRLRSSNSNLPAKGEPCRTIGRRVSEPEVRKKDFEWAMSPQLSGDRVASWSDRRCLHKKL